jgi:hypothetical protein
MPYILYFSGKEPEGAMEAEHWNRYVEIIKKMKSPLRPDQSEIQILEQVIRDFQETQCISHLNVLLLGVTEEIVHIPWPEYTMLTAVDRSETMIEAFWPGDIPGQRKLVQEDWFNMSFPEESFHMIFGDCVFNNLIYPSGYDTLAKKLSGLLLKNGYLCTRVFNQLDPKEDMANILGHYHENSSLDPDQFSFRFVSCLQESVQKGIHVAPYSIIERLIEHGISPSEYYKKCKIEPMGDRPQSPDEREKNRVTYPTEIEFVTQLHKYFNVVDKCYGKHALSYRTPVFILSRK